MTRVAVIGVGAVGATLAAWLIEDARHDVVLCARTPFDRLQVETPEGLLETRPTIWTDPAEARPVDWVLVVTKTYDAPGAALWLAGLIGTGTKVAVLQNGVEHLSRFPDVDADCLLPVIVDIPAERSAPGVVRQRRSGSLVIPVGQAGEAFADLFTRTPIEVRQTDDWKTAAWRKLAVNCAGAVNALVLKPAGIVADPEIAELMRGLVRECVAVGRAEGAGLDEGVVEEVIAGYAAGPPDSINSIHADRLAGRPTEADARNGVIARLGRRHGIDAPLNHMADVLLRNS